MKSILRFFVERRFFASMMLFMVCILGTAVLYNITLQELPASKQGETSIITEFPGVSAEEIELEVTNRIEKELKSVNGLKYYLSTTVDGYSEIEIRIRDGEDIDKVNLDIQAAVDRVTDFPANLENTPYVEAENTATFEFLVFGLTGDLPYSVLREEARQLEKKLRAVEGVGKIQTMGYFQREFIVHLDPERLNSYGLAADEVVTAISKRNISSSGGLVESWQAEEKLLTMNQVQSAEELENIVITLLPGGSPLQLKDIARVSDGFERASEHFVVNGKPGIGFMLFKTESGDIIKTVDAVKALLEAESARTQGKLEFPISLDLSEEIADRFDVVKINGMIGTILVLTVLFLTIQRRLAPWITSSLPVCVFGTLTMLMLFGFSLDSVSLSAILLIIGIIVDDSIVVAESIDQQYQKGLAPVDAAVEGYSQVFKPVLTSLLTTLIVFLPILFMGGDFGATFAILPITVIMALLMSMLDVTLLLPAHLAHALQGKRPDTSKQSHWFDGIKERYQQLLTKALRVRYVLAPVFLIIGMGTLYLGYSNLKLDFFPTSAARLIEVGFEVEDGTSLERVKEIQAPFLKLLAETPEVARYHLVPATPETIGMVVLTPLGERSRSADAVASLLEDTLMDMEGITDADIEVDAGGAPPPSPVEFRIYGSNDDSRLRLSQDLKAWLAEQEGVEELEVSDENQRPQKLIKPDYEWLAKTGLTVDDINNALNLSFEGQEASASWVGDDEVKIKVWLDSDWRQADYLPNLDITTADGEKIPLRRLATIETIETPREILHWSGDRMSLVGGDVDSGDEDEEEEEFGVDDDDADESDIVVNPTEISLKALDHFNKRLDQYPGVRLEMGGEAELTNDAFTGLKSVMIVAVIGIWMIIALLFGSLFQPLLVMIIIPFAVASAVLALLIHGQPMSFFAGIGILGLCGVVVNNALVMIDRINNHEDGDGSQGIIAAASTRLRPVLLTTVTTVVGLLPLAYGLGGADVYMGPMALTLGYGLLFTVPAVLFLLPCCYQIGQDMKRKKS